MPTELGAEFVRSANERRERDHQNLRLLQQTAQINAPRTEADTTTIGADIGNFFRVLLSFLSGL